jgi:hypothetical protein
LNWRKEIELRRIPVFFEGIGIEERRVLMIVFWESLGIGESRSTQRIF